MLVADTATTRDEGFWSFRYKTEPILYHLPFWFSLFWFYIFQVEKPWQTNMKLLETVEANQGFSMLFWFCGCLSVLELTVPVMKHNCWMSLLFAHLHLKKQLHQVEGIVWRLTPSGSKDATQHRISFGKATQWSALSNGWNTVGFFSLKKKQLGENFDIIVPYISNKLPSAVNW